MTSENKNYSAMEVGCLLLASLAYDVANLSVKGDGAQIFTQAEFSKMEKTIKGEKELSVYRIYTALHKGIVESYNKGSLTLTDKFWRGIEAQRALVRACHKAENSQKYFLKAPLVVTEHQRQDMYARAEACKKEQPHSIGWLTLYTIQHLYIAVAQVVDNHGGVAGLVELYQCVGTDESGSAGNQYVHVY